jgi:hypothetical protein
MRYLIQSYLISSLVGGQFEGSGEVDSRCCTFLCGANIKVAPRLITPINV